MLLPQTCHFCRARRGNSNDNNNIVFVVNIIIIIIIVIIIIIIIVIIVIIDNASRNRDRTQVPLHLNCARYVDMCALKHNAKLIVPHISALNKKYDKRIDP